MASSTTALTRMTPTRISELRRRRYSKTSSTTSAFSSKSSSLRSCSSWPLMVSPLGLRWTNRGGGGKLLFNIVNPGVPVSLHKEPNSLWYNLCSYCVACITTLVSGFMSHQMRKSIVNIICSLFLFVFKVKTAFIILQLGRYNFATRQVINFLVMRWQMK